MATAEADGNGGNEIQEELPNAPVAAVQHYDHHHDAGLDKAIAEEPQLATN